MNPPKDDTSSYVSRTDLENLESKLRKEFLETKDSHLGLIKSKTDTLIHHHTWIASVLAFMIALAAGVAIKSNWDVESEMDDAQELKDSLTTYLDIANAFKIEAEQIKDEVIVFFEELEGLEFEDVIPKEIRQFLDPWGYLLDQAVRSGREISPANHWILGLYYYSKKKYSEAAREFQIYLSKNEGSAQAYLFLGVARARDGNWNKSIEAYNVALDKDSSNAFILLNRGVSYMKMGKYEKALTDFDKSLELRRVSASWLQKARTYAQMNDITNLLRAADSTLSIDSTQKNEFLEPDIKEKGYFLKYRDNPEFKKLLDKY